MNNLLNVCFYKRPGDKTSKYVELCCQLLHDFFNRKRNEFELLSARSYRNLELHNQKKRILKTEYHK